MKTYQNQEKKLREVAQKTWGRERANSEVFLNMAAAPFATKKVPDRKTG